MTVRVRFAPSPTGLLHVGNAFIALHNWLFARKAGGTFLLRLDDTDVERSTPEFASAIERDLTWLGLGWDAIARQSDRTARYGEAAERLKKAERLYPCFEMQEELEAKRRNQLRRGLPPVYDRAALALGEAERRHLIESGHRPHWRFRLDAGMVEWNDLVRGPQHIDGASQSDPVLVRADGRYLYTLPSVVDDIDFAVTHVIRGADHITNTGTQIQLFRALDAAPPVFGHLPLLVDETGAGLSKRLGALSLDELHRSGLEALTVDAYLARIGTGDPMEPVMDLGDLLSAHDLAKFGGGSPRFDPRELAHLNARALHAMPYGAVEHRLAELGQAGIDETAWIALRGNIERLVDIGDWWQVCQGRVVPIVEDKGFAETAASLLPPGPWDDQAWATWTAAVSKATGAKGKALFRPLRLALTGRDHGPEMRNLLPLIGRDRALRRLAGEPE